MTAKNAGWWNRIQAKLSFMQGQLLLCSLSNMNNFERPWKCFWSYVAHGKYLRIVSCWSKCSTGHSLLERYSSLHMLGYVLISALWWAIYHLIPELESMIADWYWSSCTMYVYYLFSGFVSAQFKNVLYVKCFKTVTMRAVSLFINH